MNEDIEIEELYDVVQKSGVVEQMRVSYNTSLEDEDITVSLGTQNGRVKENDFGEDDLLYSVEEELESEYLVPESMASSPHKVAESVLDRYAETDDTSQWAMEALD